MVKGGGAKDHRPPPLLCTPIDAKDSVEQYTQTISTRLISSYKLYIRASLSLSPSLPFSLPVSLSLPLTLSLSIHISVYPFLSLPIYLSIHLSLNLSLSHRDLDHSVFVSLSKCCFCFDYCTPSTMELEILYESSFPSTMWGHVTSSANDGQLYTIKTKNLNETFKTR